MPARLSIIKSSQFVALIFMVTCFWLYLLIWAPVGHVQGTREPRPQDQSDVLRVYTELVQTDVMVFDKQGNFVKGLKREDFELRIDGKTKPIEFFEKITAGSVSEESQLAAARGTEIRAGRIPAGNTLPLDRGRPVFFYVDDMHLDLTSMVAARKLITRFIDNEMGQNDEAAIASATGQIGFLQQLTDNKSVLRAALQRLKFRSHTVQDLERPTMTEYQALLITRSDFDTTSYFVEETMRQNPGMTPETAASVVSSRAHQLVQQGGYITVSTLSGLEGLIRSANKLPGRKLVFFISGGFFLDDLNSDSRYRLQRITSAAARSGIVIYSIDARGLVASLTDASTDVNPDPSGRLLRAGMGELSATQDAMNALAYDTGGKPTFNTNALNTGLTGALKETSNYYLLAWKPDGENQHASKFRRLEVKLIGHPNLTVQVRRGFFDREPDSANTKTAKAKAPAKGNGTTETGVLPSPEAELRKVMLAPYPARDIPVSLNLSYVNTPAKGAMLTSVLQVPNEFLSFAPLQGKQTASVTLAGTVFDERGNSGANFNNHITIGADSLEAARGGQDLTYGYPVYVGPGLYQVRVGVRDDQTGRTGTAHGWIEIPNLAAGEFALSSILMGLGAQTSISNASATTNDLQNPVDLSISHRFSPDGFLRFLVFVYNSAPAGTQPDLAVQVQVIREDQPVVTTALKKISLEAIQDLSRIPYAAEVSLSGLPAGNYILKVTVVDRVAKKSASQQSRFEIE